MCCNRTTLWHNLPALLLSAQSLPAPPRQENLHNMTVDMGFRQSAGCYLQIGQPVLSLSSFLLCLPPQGQDPGANSVSHVNIFPVKPPGPLYTKGGLLHFKPVMVLQLAPPHSAAARAASIATNRMPTALHNLQVCAAATRSVMHLIVAAWQGVE
jgi:hypothetical protein